MFSVLPKDSSTCRLQGLHYLWPPLSLCICLPSLSSLSYFRCLPVHPTAGIKKQPLKCCQCPPECCHASLESTPSSTSLRSGLNEPCSRNDSLLHSASWEDGVTTGGQKCDAHGKHIEVVRDLFSQPLTHDKHTNDVHIDGHIFPFAHCRQPLFYFCLENFANI